MELSWQKIKTYLNKDVFSILTKSFEKMTPVQAATIPLFLKNKDVVVEAVTGSGKTLAFIVPLIEMLLKRESPLHSNEVGALIISPTRELATQTSQVLNLFLKHLTQFSQQLLIGGNNPGHDIKHFEESGAHIIVATPGRLEDMFQKSSLSQSVKALEVLILDEADRLLDMGFETTLNTILGYLPKQRRTGLFSATQTQQLEDLIRAGLRNPVRVCVKEKTTNSQEDEGRTPATLKNYYMECPSEQKLNVLVSLLRKYSHLKIMVFVSTCACVDYFGEVLKRLLPDSQVCVTHGKKDNRRKIFEKFREQNHGVLISTDVMGRGVDIPSVHWVFQFDPPTNPSDFVHRCGRTARIGNTGNALLLLRPSEDTFIEFLAINQKVHLIEIPCPTPVENIHPQVHRLACEDRLIYERSLRAFVSFVQSYGKHECHLIFRLKDLDLGSLATGYALLHLPKMPELKGKTVSNFQRVEINVKTIPYRDKNLEKQRKNQDNVKKKKERKTGTVSWSDQKMRKDRRKKRKEAKKRKVDERTAETYGTVDEEELDEDTRLLKKLKKRKISAKEFNKQFGAWEVTAAE